MGARVVSAMMKLNAEVDAIEERAERRAAYRALPIIAKRLTESLPCIPLAAACFFKDGNMWCCVLGSFINLQESPAGFGETMNKALDNLLSEIAKATQP